MDRGMIAKLDIISDEILMLFSEVKGPLCVREIEVYLGESTKVILMSLGWLVREGMVSTVIMNDEHYYHRLLKAELKKEK